MLGADMAASRSEGSEGEHSALVFELKLTLFVSFADFVNSNPCKSEACSRRGQNRPAESRKKAPAAAASTDSTAAAGSTGYESAAAARG